MFSIDVHKLKFKVSIRSDVFKLRYDEISFLKKLHDGRVAGWVGGWLVGWDPIKILTRHM